MVRPAPPSPLSARAIDYLGVPQADVPVRVLVERLDYRAGYYNPPTVTPDERDRGDAPTPTGGSRRSDACPTQPGSYRVARRRAGRASARSATTPGCGCRAHAKPPADGEHDYLELLADKRTLRARRHRASRRPRPRRRRARCCVTKEGQHVSWHQVVRPTAAGAFEIPIDRAATSATSTCTSRCCATAGCIRPSGAWPCRRPRARCNIALTADQPVAKPQDPASFTVQVTRRRRPAGAGQRQPGGDRRSGVRRQGRRHAGSGAVLLPPRVHAGRHGVLARLPLHRFSGTDRLHLASRRRRPMSLADFKADRRRSRRCARTSPTRSTGWPTLVTDARGPRTGHRQAIPTRSRRGGSRRGPSPSTPGRRRRWRARPRPRT